jgi:hypothetical protein
MTQDTGEKISLLTPNKLKAADSFVQIAPEAEPFIFNRKSSFLAKRKSA